MLSEECRLEGCKYLDQYRIIRTLGEGYFSKVKLAENPDKQLVAIKKFKLDKFDPDIIKEQLKVISKLHHQNLINLITLKENAEYLRKNGKKQICFALVLEYAGGGELFDYILDSGKFDEKCTRTFLVQLLAGIEYMHNQGYSHRDLKPENIFLTDEFNLKIGDFGFAAPIKGKDRSGMLHTMLGTEGYMAPQIYSEYYKGTQVDIFALGVILFIMHGGLPPFQKSLPNDRRYKFITQNKFQKFWQEHVKTAKNFSADFKNLIQRMLEYEPLKRITLDQIKVHPFLKDKAIMTQEQLKTEFTKRKEKVDKQIQKKKQERQRKKQNRTANLFTHILNLFRGSKQKIQFESLQDPDPEIFAMSYQKYQQYTQLDDLIPTKPKSSFDFEVKEQAMYLFANLTTLFSKQICIDWDDTQLIFIPKYQLQNHHIFNVECVCKQLDQSITFKIQITRPKIHESTHTETQQTFNLTFIYQSGNNFYYRMLMNRIKDQCEDNEPQQQTYHNYQQQK